MNAQDLADSVLVGIWLTLLGAALFLISAQLVDVLRSLIITLTHPYSLSYTGGYLGYYVAHPFQLYQPPDPVPHPTIYPPLLPLLVPKLPGVNIYISTRAFNWLVIAGSASMLGYLALERTDRWANAGLASMLFLLSAAVVGMTVLLRVDHLGLFLTLAAIVAYQRDWRLAAVGGLCVAAGFAKQPYAVISIGTIAATLWMRDDRRLALRFTATTAAAGLALLGVLVAVTDGWAFVHLFVYNLAVPWYQEAWLSQMHTFLYTHGLLVGIALGVTLGLGRDALESPVVWLLTIGVAVALATIGKEGAWIGYLYPVIAASAVLASEAIQEFNLLGEVSTRRRAVTTVVVLLLVGQLYMYTLWFPYNEKSLGAQHYTAEQLADVNGDILAEEPSIAPDQEPVDVLMVQGLIHGGALEGDPLAEALRCGRYEMVATWLPADGLHEDSRFTEAQLEAIRGHYDPVFPQRGFSLHRYNGSGSCRQPV